MSISLEEFTLLAWLLDGPRTLKSLKNVSSLGNKRTPFLLMKMEQSKLILGVGLPKEYGILKDGERAVREFREQVSVPYHMSDRVWD